MSLKVIYYKFIFKEGIMYNISKYFTQGTIEWQKTAKVCIMMGFFIGLIIGGIILKRIIN